MKLTDILKYYVKLSLEDKITELLSILVPNFYSKYSELFYALWNNISESSYSKFAMEKIIEMFNKIQTDYPHIIDDNSHFVLDVFLIALELDNKTVADHLLTHLLDCSEYEYLFYIIYPAIYFDHFDVIGSRMKGEWLNSYSYPPEIELFFHHFYLLDRLQGEYKSLDVESAFESIEQENQVKLSELRKNIKWILGEETSDWNDTDLGTKNNDNWKLNITLMSYELLHFVLNHEKYDGTLAIAEIFRAGMMDVLIFYAASNTPKNYLSRFFPRYNGYSKAISSNSREYYCDFQEFRELIALKYLPLFIEFLVMKKLISNDNIKKAKLTIDKILRGYKDWSRIEKNYIAEMQIDKVKTYWSNL